jgi:hypothetical protein
VPQPGSIAIFDASTGAPTGSIAASLNFPTGICFAARAPNNKPPVAICADQTVAADATCHAAVSIDGGSFDPDSDAFRCVQLPEGPFGEGTTPVTLTCSDSHGASSSCTANVNVVDTAPPAVVTRDAGVLWPPDHQYHRIRIADCVTSIQDACSGSLDVASHATFTCCTSDEPDHGRGDGDTINDCVIVDGHDVDVRAERIADGNGRVYTLHVTVNDDAGNTSDHTCRVSVPHSQDGAPAIDDGAQTTCRP